MPRCANCDYPYDFTLYRPLGETDPLLFCASCLYDEQANDTWQIQHPSVVGE